MILVTRLRDTLVPFIALNPRMPARAVEMFWVVCDREGLNVEAYAERVGCSATTASRFLLDLGERNRWGEPGSGLVEGYTNVLDRRESLYRLTAKGRELRDKILWRFK